jgi:hypothetical protein
MPSKAGIQVTRHQIFWIPAFAGMTDRIAENSPTAQLFKEPLTCEPSTLNPNHIAHHRDDPGGDDDGHNRGDHG